jgi:hypothetical protein
MPNSNMNFKSWLMSYVCSECFYVYFLYAWTSTYVAFCMKEVTEGHNIMAYAFLTSALFTGRVLGRVIYKTRHTFRVGITKNNLNRAFILLIVLFMGVAITTRYSFLVLLYFMIGFTAARVGASQDDKPESMGQRQTYSSNTTASEMETEFQAKRKIVVFMFSTLFSSQLYQRTKDPTASFPAYQPNFVFSMVLIVILLLNVLSDRTILYWIYSCMPCKRTVISRSKKIGEC